MKLKETIERENSCHRGENRCKLSNTKKKGGRGASTSQNNEKKKAREIFGPFWAVLGRLGSLRGHNRSKIVDDFAQ